MIDSSPVPVPGDASAPAVRRPPLWRRLRVGWWMLALVLALCGYGAWREYDFRQAIEEATALGWKWKYDDPIDAIRKDWKAAFRRATWTDGRRDVRIDVWQVPLERMRIIQRLAPRALQIYSFDELRDLSPFAGLSELRELCLYDCPRLESIDALRSLPKLRTLALYRCLQIRNMELVRGLRELEVLQFGASPQLANVDALASLSKLKELRLNGGSITELPALNALTELNSVALDGCVNLQNVNALKSLPALQRLVIFSCSSLTDLDGVAGLPALQEIRIVDCNGFTALGWLSNLPALEVIDIRNCESLTNVDAVKSLKSLKVASFSGTGISEEQVKGLEAALPGVRIWGP